MVTAVYGRSENRFSLHMTGHATGSSAVCAACSAIVYTLLGWLENSPEHAHIGSAQACSGAFSLDAAGDGQAGAVFDAALLGLMQIEAQYPELVRVTENGEFAGECPLQSFAAGK